MAKTTKPSRPDFKLTARQREAAHLIAGPAQNILLRGGSRSGKSAVIAWSCIQDALKVPGARIGIFRKTAVSCRSTLFSLTVPDIMDRRWPGLRQQCDIRSDDMTIRLPNGSMLMFFGLDDGDRIQKILGQEFYVIWMNEATEFDDDQFETLQSRLAQTNLIPDRGRLKYKMLIDCNPDSSQHFTYRSFILKQNADGDPFPDPENFVELKMLGEDNAENLPVGYLEGQNRLSAAKRRRYQAGEWKIEVEGALFYQEWTDATRITQDELPDLVRIVVAVDPAGSDGVKADETGLVVAGVDEDGHGYVLADCTLKGTPEQWGKAVAKAYEEFKAAMVVADHGYGGQMVDSTIRNAHPAIKIGTVDGKRGKVLRADGVSALYEQGKVSHVGEFKKLETQMCQFTGEWKRGKDKSPDRLDALVYALTELMIVERQVRKGRSVQASGFW